MTVVEEIRKRKSRVYGTAIGWVNAHKGIEGNKHEDQGTK